MPTLTHRACTHPGCARTEPHSHGHTRDERPSAAQRGYDAHHQRWRKVVLANCPVCAICRRKLTNVADHIQRIADGGARYDLENSQGLCYRCHNFKTHHVDPKSKGLTIPEIQALQRKLYEEFQERARAGFETTQAHARTQTQANSTESS